MIQIHLASDQTPVRATYAQHKDGETCAWHLVERTGSDRPVVYVGLGSHASFFRPGPDGSDDLGEWTTPSLEDMTTVPAWLGWPGKWGGSDNSPEGPGNGGNSTKWHDPLGWSNSSIIKPCSVPTAQARAAQARQRRPRARSRFTGPPVPEVGARRIGRKVMFRYRFPTAPRKSPRPRYLVTTADANGSKYPPMTKFTRVRRRAGLVRQPLGLGREPFRFYVSVMTSNGRRSAVVPVRVRR